MDAVTAQTKPIPKGFSLSASRSQAYLNEYKGNVFEYLVGLALAQKFDLEADFINSLGDNQLNLLLHYESEIKKISPSLARELPLLAERTALETIETLSPASLTEIRLLGKPQALGGKARGDEGDLRVSVGAKTIPLSLKLGKVSSFINTKSGGIKSFVAEYFGAFDPYWAQRELNEFLEDSYLQMGEQLYRQNGLDFQGSWDARWKEAGLSELPGELPGPLRPMVYDHYKRVTSKLYTILRDFYERDAELFKHCLCPLLGLSRELTQIKVYHQDHKFHSLAVVDQKTLAKILDSMTWPKGERGKGVFHIDFHRHRFQLRPKPMNKFTAMALKVNCSVKFHS
ncbi:MAG: hypothetical protein OXB88_03245 [Bacteriovoracales bacterium]|nr:hypothetical protein [Bacteriovoracales bacterium]